MKYLAIQTVAFDVGEETTQLQALGPELGAVASFVGQMRNSNTDEGREAVIAMTLEHYPGMAEKAIGKIIDKAFERWPLLGVRVIHRVGRLLPGDPIVYVGVASSHRTEAFQACEFIMDFLKTAAPFWKKEELAGKRERWVEARESDTSKLGEWK